MVDNNSNKTAGIIRLPVAQLYLDTENPRLASGQGGDTQEDLLKVLWNEMAVDELVMSIAANGFFPEESLFVIAENPKEKEESKKRYTVVEGNRRLAAVRLLRDNRLREKLKATDLPKISKKAHSDLDTLPVSIYPNRKALWQYFGFRHINGPKAWDAFSKAKYVADVHEKYKISLDVIAKKIGDRHSTVKRFYRGYVLLRQAEKSGFNREDRIRNRFFFSHLFTAADQPEFQRFIGISSENSLKPDPVRKSKLPELIELMIWLYGSRSRGKEPVVRTQNPDLNVLRVVIGKQGSLAALRSGFALERAHEIALGDRQRFRESLAKAKEDLIQANGSITLGYVGDDELFEMISEIAHLVESMRETMEKKRRKLR